MADPVTVGFSGGLAIMGAFSIAFHIYECYERRQEKRKLLTSYLKPKPKFKMNMMSHLKNHISDE